VGPGLRAVVGQAAGNPLYVREMVDALIRDGRLRREGGTAELVEDDESGGVPVSLAAAISARLGFVSEQTATVLRAAALLGAEFTITDLGVVTGRPPTGLSAAVAEAMAAGVLVESGLRLGFRHVLIRQALYDGTPAALRLALHRQAARALAEAGAAVEQTAEQLLAAVPETDAVGVVDGWVLDWLAGPGRVLSYRSPKAAAELLSRAVEHTAPDDPRREALEVILASVLVMLGRPEEAVRRAERVRAGTHDPARAAEISYTLARALNNLQRYEQAKAVLTDALRDPDADGVWAVRMRAFGLAVAVSGGDFDQETTAREALGDAELIGDRIAAADAANVLCVSLFYRGGLTASLPVLERSLATLGEDLHTADLRLLMLYNRLAILETLDRLAEADVAARELVTAAERYAAPHRLAVSRCGAADYYYQVGRWDEALAELETLADGAIPVAPSAQPLLHGVWALIAAHRDDQAAAEAHLAAVAGQPVAAGVAASHAQWLIMTRAVLAERRGHPEQALAALADMLDPSYPGELPDRRKWLPDLTRLALTVGDAATAGAASAATADDADAEPTPSVTAAAGHCRGLLDGDPAPLLAAADAYRTVGRPFELARVLEDAAVLLAERGDLPAARAAYTEAVEHYIGLRADWDLLRADTRLRPYGIRRGQRRRRRPATGWDALTPTELKVAHLVAEGNSNADIATRLFLSRRTAELHVSRILTKLDARSRVQIARHAATHPPVDPPAAPAPRRPTRPGVSTG
jgi:DNA-binding CsgD family transcriptional regulator/tetratricopeptide (TPR) repeat protein